MNQSSAQTSVNCPCGSEKKYAQCCEPLHLKKSKAKTAEELMRSRYCAYVKHNIDYIVDTHDPNNRADFDREAAEIWAKDSEWLGLEILKSSENNVEFRARFKFEGKESVHHELSEFRFDSKDQCWYFVDGKPINDPVVRAEPKIGRNDPCSCGSGKKFKKCCAA